MWCAYFATCFGGQAHKQIAVLNAFICLFILQESCATADARGGSFPQTAAMLKAQELRILFNGGICYKTSTGSISHAFPEKKSTVAAHQLIAL